MFCFYNRRMVNSCSPLTYHPSVPVAGVSPALSLACAVWVVTRHLHLEELQQALLEGGSQHTVRWGSQYTGRWSLIELEAGLNNVLTIRS